MKSTSKHIEKSPEEIQKQLFETENFTSIVEIPEKLYQYLVKPSTNDGEEEGKVSFENGHFVLHFKNKESYELSFDKMPFTTMIFKPKDDSNIDGEELETDYEPIEFPKIRGKAVKVNKPVEVKGKGMVVQEDQPNQAKINLRATKLLMTEVNRDKLPRANLRLKAEEDSIVRRKLEEPELREELFILFSEKSQMSFDEIQAEVRQPRNFVQTVLDDICEKRKVRNKFMYNLKAEYLQNEDKIGKPSKKLKS